MGLYWVRTQTGRRQHRRSGTVGGAFCSTAIMNSRICVCCGEPMADRGNALSRNPNVCASCSSLADGMDESSVPESVEPARPLGLTSETAPPDALRSQVEAGLIE